MAALWNLETTYRRRAVLATIFILIGLLARPGERPVWGQAQPATDTQSFRLVHADAGDIVASLRRMLLDADAPADVMVDRAMNRILVRGADPTRQIAAQLIETLDVAPVSKVVPAANQQRAKVQGYRVAADRLESTADQLRTRFATDSSVRVAVDRRTSQLVIIAPDAVHGQIAQLLANQPAVAKGELQWQPRRVPELSPPDYRLKYHLQNISWRQLESRLHQMFGPALSISVDPSRTVAMIRSAVDPDGAPVMKLDRSTNEVAFSNTRGAGQSWRQVIAALDGKQALGKRTTQLVPLQRADPEQVRETVTMIRDAAIRTAPGQTMATVPVAKDAAARKNNGLVSMIFQPTQEGTDASGAQPPAGGAGDEGDAGTPGAETEPGDEALADEDLGMLGDVQIEFVPELGVIILRGNKKDVERVQKIINEIEARTDETRPEVEVVPLAHANSEALGELVTNVYTEVYAPRQGDLSITSLVKPNSILLVGKQENIATGIELIAKLDRPVDPDTQIKVFHLLNMNSTDAEQYLQSFYGASGGAGGTTGGGTQNQVEARGLSPRMAVIGDVRSNSLIVQASPRDLLEVADLLRKLDVEKTPASVELRVIPLKNSIASELQTVLTNTLGGQGQQTGGQQGQTTGQNQTPASKSVQIMGIDQKGNKIIESGLLTDVVVTADDNANSLLVRAPAHSMGLIVALVEQLDKMPAAESQIKVFQIQNGDATSLTTMLQTLFGQQVTAGQIGAFSQTVGRTFGAGAQLQQSSSGESSLIPLTFGVDARSNSIIVSGSRSDLAVIEAILLRLDEGDLRQRELIVYRLNNAPAQFVADALTAILQDQQTLLQQQQSQTFSLISQFEFIDQQVFVTPEVISNTLIVSATPKYYEQITAVIEDLDRRPPMIAIQAVIVLVRLEDAEELGVELGLQDSLLFDRGTVSEGLISPGFNFIGQALGNADTAASRATRELLGGQAASSFNVGRSSGSEGFPGLVLSASNESINVLIRALVKNSRAQLLSRPQIMTMNNVPASVLVGQRVPQITDFQVTNQGTVNSVTLNETGISLGVIPRVTPDGLIIMDIEARDSQVGDPADGIPIGVQGGVAINSPIFDDITAITTIAARDGQTVVFGGMITTNRTDTFRGVPYLSNIPVLGRLFRFDTQSTQRNELLFFLTPRIVVTDEQVQALNQAEAARMSWCLSDVVELHGDPGFGPGGANPWEQATPTIYPDQDPTAHNGVFPQGTEQVTTPQPAPPAVPEIPRQGPRLGPGEMPGSTPFIRPPDQRQPGKPWVEPPAGADTGDPNRQSQAAPGGIRVQYRPNGQPGTQPPSGPNGLRPYRPGYDQSGRYPQEPGPNAPRDPRVAPNRSGVPLQGIVPAQYQETPPTDPPRSGGSFPIGN